MYEYRADFSKLSRRERRNLWWNKLVREFRKRVELVLAEKRINVWGGVLFLVNSTCTF